MIPARQAPAILLSFRFCFQHRKYKFGRIVNTQREQTVSQSPARFFPVFLSGGQFYKIPQDITGYPGVSSILSLRVLLLGLVSHEISGNNIQIDGEHLAVTLSNALKIRFQSVMILNIAVPCKRIISNVLCTADIFSYMNAGNRFYFSLIGICNGKWELLLCYLMLLDRINKK